MKRLSLTLAAAVVVAALAALTASSRASSAGSCTSGYAYAGLTAASSGAGISARVAAVRAPDVVSGHVAAWVGVGGEGLGPNGTDEWIQVGTSALAGGVSHLYYEVTVAGAKPQYHDLGRFAPGTTRQLAVLEMRGRPGQWRVWVDGSPVTKPIFLPKSHGAWAPIATAESWDGGSGACNSFAYEFSRVRMVTHSSARWSPLRGGAWFADRGYRIVKRSSSSFFASRA